MREETWLDKLLKRLGLIKTYEVSKKEMCESAKSVCNRDCKKCVWNEKKYMGGEKPGKEQDG